MTKISRLHIVVLCLLILVGNANVARCACSWHAKGGEVPGPGLRVLIDGKSSPKMPRKLYLDSRNGPTSVTIDSHLVEGYYRLSLTYRNSEKAAPLRVAVDGRLQSHYDTYYFDAPGAARCYHYTFRIDDSLIHSITVGMAPVTEVYRPGYASELEIESISIDRITPAVSRAEHLHRPLIDLWGWLVSPDYQRAAVADPEYMVNAAVREPWKWGANMIQAYPHFTAANWLKPWGQNRIDSFLEACHKYGFLVDCHAGSDPNVADRCITLANRWGRLNGAVLDRGWDRLVDTWETEATTHAFHKLPAEEVKPKTIALTNALWQYNPGTPVNLCDQRPNTWQGGPGPWDCVKFYRGPNFVKTVMCANSCLRNGHVAAPVLAYTDMNPLRVFPGDLGMNDGTRDLFIAYQADCRMFSFSPSGPFGSIFGGGTTPDLVLRQVDDMFRPRALEPDRVHETAVFWLGEPDKTWPKSLRSAVYAASMDPIKRAFTARLSAMGFDGTTAAKQTIINEVSNERVECPWMPVNNEPFPSSTSFIQNDRFRLLRFAEGDYGMLQFDPQRLAHFDSNSLSVVLASDLGTEPPCDPIALAGAVVTPYRVQFRVEFECGKLALDFQIATRADEVEVLVDGRKVGQVICSKGGRSLPIDLGHIGRHELEIKASNGRQVHLAGVKLFPANLIRDNPLFAISRTADVRGRESLEIDLRKGPGKLPSVISANGLNAPRSVSFSFDANEQNCRLSVLAGSSSGAIIRVYRDGWLARDPFTDKDVVYKQGLCGQFHIPAGGPHQLSIPVDLLYDGAHVIELVAMQGSCVLQRIEMRSSAVTHRWVERGGHRAVLEETLRRRSWSGSTVTEVRRYTADSGAPYVSCNISRTGSRSDWRLSIQVPGYETLMNESDRLEDSCILPATRLLRIGAASKCRPDLVLGFPHCEQISSVSWTKGKSLDIRCPGSTSSLTLLFIAPDVSKGQLERIVARASQPITRISLSKHGATAAAIPTDIEHDKVVLIDSTGSGPYCVLEDGWWYYRGGQPASLHPGSDYLKLRGTSGARVQVAQAGYIDGIVRHGWGCQYLMAIGEASRNQSGAECLVRVNSATAYVFAPRIEFDLPFDKVSIDGRDWPYYDGRFVFLPTRPGEYRVCVENSGRRVPHLICSSGMLAEGRWDDASSSLHLHITAQPWTQSVAEGQLYYALIHREGRVLKAIEGAELVQLEDADLSDEQRRRMAEKGFAVRFSPSDSKGSSSGRFSIFFER